MTNNESINGKDLINIGIYAAIFCVITTAISMLGFIPVLMPLLAVLVPLVGGVPMMLFYTKVGKFGMITIMSAIIGVFMTVTGMGIWPTVFGVACGLAADLIARNGNYESARATAMSYGVMCVTFFGCFLPLYLNINEYFASRSSYGEDYVASLTAVMQPWTAPLILLSCLVFGILGALFGQRMMAKHFQRAGIA